MTQPGRLPYGIQDIAPQTALFAEVCRRLGVENAPADSVLVRYDQRSGWLAFGSVAGVLIILYRSLPLIIHLAHTRQAYAIILLALAAAFLGLFLAVFARFFFIAAFGVHWFLCAPKGIHFLRYSPVAARALRIDRIAVAGVEIGGDGLVTNFRYTLTIALHDGTKRTLITLDPSWERIQCLQALLERRCMPPRSCQGGENESHPNSHAVAGQPL